MISPIGATNFSRNLEPVKVPHFCGVKASKEVATKADSFEFQTQPKDILNAAKQGAFKGYTAIKHGCKKGAEFTSAFVNSLAQDIKAIGIQRSVNKISTVDNIGDKFV